MTETNICPDTLGKRLPRSSSSLADIEDACIFHPLTFEQIDWNSRVLAFEVPSNTLAAKRWASRNRAQDEIDTGLFWYRRAFRSVKRLDRIKAVEATPANVPEATEIHV